MASKLAIVFGATGNVGAGIARQLVKNGSKVVLPVRNVSKLSADIREAATAKPDTVTVIEADTATSEGMSKVLNDIEARFGKNSIDVLVSVFGGPGPYGPSYNANVADFNSLVEASRPRFIAWSVFGKHFVENAAARSTPVRYIEVTGTAALSGEFGITGVAAGGVQVSLARAEIHETKDIPMVSATEVCLGYMVKDDAEFQQMAAAGQAPPYARPSSHFAQLVGAIVDAQPIEKVKGKSIQVPASLLFDGGFEKLLASFKA